MSQGLADAALVRNVGGCHKTRKVGIQMRVNDVADNSFCPCLLVVVGEVQLLQSLGVFLALAAAEGEHDDRVELARYYHLR